MRKTNPKLKRPAEMHAYIRSLRGKYAGILGGKTTTEVKAKDRADELARDERRMRLWLG
jgi:hypothetical protein